MLGGADTATDAGPTTTAPLSAAGGEDSRVVEMASRKPAPPKAG
jgi:hypothetical protein